MKKKRIRLITALLLTILLVAGCGQNAANGKSGSSDEIAAKESSGKTEVVIGYLPITHALPVFAEKEYLESQNSDVQITLQKFSSWTDLTDALNAGKIDGASMLAELAMNAVSKGIDLKAVALGHRDGNVVVVSDKITKTEDLKGKTFAIPSNQSSHYILLNTMLENAGMKIEDVNVTQLAPAEMPSSLASGAIDGYCVAEPFGAQAVASGIGHVLYDSTDLWENSICCAFVLRGDFISGQADTAQTVIDGYFAAADSLTADSEMTLAKNYLGQQEDTLQKSFAWISFNDLEISEKDYNALAALVKKDGINENPPAYEDFVYTAK